MSIFKSTMVLAVVLATALSAWAQEPAARGEGVQQDQTAELAKKAQNPVADLMIMPLQYNIDFGIGPAEASQQTLKFMPVIPFSLGQDWNLITRTIIPWIDAESPVEGGEDYSGLGDIQQSFFFTPKKPVSGWILGAGPIFQYPAATEDALGSEKWGAGPSFIALQQRNGWTWGMLANHVWSFAGNDDRAEVNMTFLQLFHGVRHSWDLGYRSILMAMENLRTNLTYLPVVSRPNEEPVPWKGATGHVQDVWKSGAIEKAWGSRPAPENSHVFMCGSSHMSESMIALLAQEGFKEDTKKEPAQIHVEKYWQ